MKELKIVEHESMIEDNPFRLLSRPLMWDDFEEEPVRRSRNALDFFLKPEDFFDPTQKRQRYNYDCDITETRILKEEVAQAIGKELLSQNDYFAPSYRKLPEDEEWGNYKMFSYSQAKYPSVSRIRTSKTMRAKCLGASLEVLNRYLTGWALGKAPMEPVIKDPEWVPAHVSEIEQKIMAATLRQFNETMDQCVRRLNDKLIRSHLDSINWGEEIDVAGRKKDQDWDAKLLELSSKQKHIDTMKRQINKLTEDATALIGEVEQLRKNYLLGLVDSHELPFNLGGQIRERIDNGNLKPKLYGIGFF